MITLQKKPIYTVGIMTGSFHTDYSARIANTITQMLQNEDADVRVVLMQGIDAKRYLSTNTSVDENFDRHYYSLFEYGKFIKPDLLIVSFGTVSAVPSRMDAKDFLAPFSGVPIIMIEDDTDIENGIYVMVDNYQGMYECVEHLIANHNKKRILFISGPKGIPDADRRLDAYLDCMRRHGLDVSDDMIAEGDFSDQVDPLIEELLDKNPDTDAICCGNDEMAESAYRVLKSRGLRPGVDIAVTGFDDSGNAKYMHPPLTTVRQSFNAVADEVCNAIRNLLHGKSANSSYVPAKLVLRGSCGCEYDISDRKEEEIVKASEDRIRIKSMQTQSIVSSLILRDLLIKGLSSKDFFERLGKVLRDVGTKRALVCRVDSPISTEDKTGFFLPDELYLQMSLYDEDITAYGFEDSVLINADTIAKLTKTNVRDGMQGAIFPLFYQKEHYGVLFVELIPEDMLFYYNLSIELGTGISFLRMELDNQKVHKTLEENLKVLDYNARHDVLTGCYTRREIIAMADERIKALDDNEKYIVAIADLDYLKRINDTFGHDEGDFAIKKASDILKYALSDEGIIGRAGGDEFICFMPESESYNSEHFIREVKKSCAFFNESSDKPYYLDITVGCCTLSKAESDDFTHAFKKADERLYVAKEFRRKDFAKEKALNLDGTEKELRRYLNQIEEIRMLSVPKTERVSDPVEYRKKLVDNYTKISNLSKDNVGILANHLFPILNQPDDLLQREIKTIRSFAVSLNDSHRLNNMDGPLVYHQALRLLREADRTQDDNIRIIALEEVISASFFMLTMTERLYPVSDICMVYHDTITNSTERILAYLDKEKFVTLTDDSKRIVIKNLRNTLVSSMADGIPSSKKQNSDALGAFKRAMAMAEDDFYRAQMGEYDWDAHRFLSLVYASSLLDYNNENNFGPEDIQYINACTKQLKELFDANNEKFASIDYSKNYELHSIRNAYLAGEIGIKRYKVLLAELIYEFISDFPDGLHLAIPHSILEYLLVLEPNKLTGEEKKNLLDFYHTIIAFMHQAQKEGKLTVQLTFMTLILKNFIEIPGEFTFEDMAMCLLAALHPPTFAHTLGVADFAKCLTGHLLDKNPEVFIGMPGINTIDDVFQSRDEILDHAYHASICHDFGKLAIYETIITYGRNLLDEEFEYIKAHPALGAYFISRFNTTAKYADATKGHHKWFDNKGGYPQSFDFNASPYKAITCIVTCADSIDAATDNVGRSYKDMKTLEEVLEEIKAASGTRYAPFVTELLDDEEIIAELNHILDAGRNQNYIDTYHSLVDYDPRNPASAKKLYNRDKK